MNLSTNSQSSGTQFPHGILVSEVSVKSARDISGEKLDFMQSAADIGVQLTLDIGKDFDPEMNITGNFKRDGLGEIIAWGGAFKVRDLLKKLGYEGDLGEGNVIPPGVVETFIGRKFFRLSYVSGIRENGKKKYSDWSEIAVEPETPQDLYTRFMKSVEKGYPRNFTSDGVAPNGDAEPAVAPPASAGF